LTKGSTDAEKRRWYWMRAMQQDNGIGRPFPAPADPDPLTRQVRRANERRIDKDAASALKAERAKRRAIHLGV